MGDAAVQLESFIAKFDSGNQALIRQVRSALQARLPDCGDLVWDNYNFFVIGYSPNGWPSDYIVSIAASAAGVGLSFNKGDQLEDPDHILLGSGKVNRFIRLPSAEVLTEPKVEAMLRRAIEASSVRRPWSGEANSSSARYQRSKGRGGVPDWTDSLSVVVRNGWINVRFPPMPAIPRQKADQPQTTHCGNCVGKGVECVDGGG